jgi:hypothetical protein
MPDAAAGEAAAAVAVKGGGCGTAASSGRSQDTDILRSQSMNETPREPKLCSTTVPGQRGQCPVPVPELEVLGPTLVPDSRLMV